MTTTIQNTELLVNGDPVKNVTVVIETAVDAAMASGTSSVVPSLTIRSDDSGFWSVNLIPSVSLIPSGVAYRVTRIFPRKYGGDRHVDYIIVPPSGGPYTLAQVTSSGPDVAPLSETELSLHLAASNPHPQYLTQDEGDDLYEPLGGSGGVAPDASPTVKGLIQLAGDLEGTAAAPQVKDTVITGFRLNQFATPNASVPMGSQKLINQAKGTAATDSANMQNILDHENRLDDPHAAANYAIMPNGSRITVSDTAPTSPAPVESDLWIEKTAAITHAYKSGAWTSSGTVSGRRVVQGGATGPPTSGTYVQGEIAISANQRLWTCQVGGTPGTWFSEPRITVSATAPSNPLTNDLWVVLS